MNLINQTLKNRLNLEFFEKEDNNNLNNINRSPMSYTTKTFNKIKSERINSTNENKYRKELIMAKVIISELQDSIEILKQEKNDLEIKLEETLNTLKFLHSDYISLTQKLDNVNQVIITDANNTEKNYENKIKELKLKNDELKEELNTKKEISKMQEEALEKKIALLEKKLEKTEEELNNTKKKWKYSISLEKNKDIMDKENFELREDNIKMSTKFNADIKRMRRELEEYKNMVKKLESENFLVKNELNENKNMLEKEQKINEQKYQIDKYLNNDLETKNDKYETIKKKYNILLKEKNDLEQKYQQMKLKNNNSIFKEELEITKEQNKYILNLLLRITPNAKLIRQIVELNKEIIQLERKKILIMNNKNQDDKIKSIVFKINDQIDTFKNNLSSLEDELINVDFGSSQENSLDIAY